MEKGNSDKNHRNLSRPVKKKPVSPGTSWVRKCISLRNVENTHLFCGNGIANEEMVLMHWALQLQNGAFRECLGKKSHWKLLPWFMMLQGLLLIILPHHSLDTKQTQLRQTHWDLEEFGQENQSIHSLKSDLRGSQCWGNTTIRFWPWVFLLFPAKNRVQIVSC